jgi:hypothetical protein
MNLDYIIRSITRALAFQAVRGLPPMVALAILIVITVLTAIAGR